MNTILAIALTLCGTQDVVCNGEVNIQDMERILAKDYTLYLTVNFPKFVTINTLRGLSMEGCSKLALDISKEIEYSYHTACVLED